MSERKVALVTNGMSGIGSAVCRRLYQDGFQVTALYPPHQSTPEAWLAAQRDDGFAFTTLCADAGAAAACALVVDRLLTERGRLDVLVNVAELPAVAATSLRAVTPARWQSVRAMLDAAFNITKPALPIMQAQRWGRVIHVAAAPAFPLPGGSQAVDQAAANAALQGLTRALALEVAHQRVTVNTIVPGWIACDGAGDAPPSLQHIPVGRPGTAHEVAALAAYLASELAGFVTGAQIAINGGQHMQ